ncbi:Lipoprotein-releasing system transmembrane protein LolE [Dyadobacter sp. CECT 9275]|uniref:Lipoprotein-releasing system transmembrane protein LolE n=1 Tax=Dyadobacter helix TaxID=2822344 RepID=A0A916JEI3_9BACT|nr:FtsX-like permease family protein [Dyadobacter sp. CECT 9275]CAG5004694.1 Lipoprotein-releasing system transmembrane protein LolE [Dyadobacter sp. CECT 9275]
MNLSYRIAVRYFFSRNKRSFISLIARIAMAGVAVGTMALVVVLSVFNGMEDLNRSIFRTFDADVTITPLAGKRFKVSAPLLRSIQGVEGVKLVTQVIEDNALAHYAGQQTIIKLKGVDSTYAERNQLDTAIIEGSMQLYGPNGTPYAIISEGIRNALSISLQDIIIPLELWYPKSNTRAINLNSTDAFNQIAVRPGGVFFIETRYDDYVIVPIKVAEALLGYHSERSSLEIQIKPGYTEAGVSQRISSVLGAKFIVKDRDSMNADLLRAIGVEKLFVTITLSFIILVAGINIFFSLSMLAIEKKKDIMMLYTMGATPLLVKKIFLTEGAIVAFTGAGFGILSGIAICWAQIQFGLVSMGMVSSLVDAYPVKLIWNDIFMAGAIIVMITLAVSYVPAQRAAKPAEPGRL